jgi:hypothetical protein
MIEERKKTLSILRAEENPNRPTARNSMFDQALPEQNLAEMEKARKIAQLQVRIFILQPPELSNSFIIVFKFVSFSSFTILMCHT